MNTKSILRNSLMILKYLVSLPQLNFPYMAIALFPLIHCIVVCNLYSTSSLITLDKPLNNLHVIYGILQGCWHRLIFNN